MRLVLEHREDYASEWATIVSIAHKLDLNPETLRKWIRQTEIDGGQRPGIATEERARIRNLEKEVKELRRANEILKAASIFFATELDGQPRRS